MKSEIRSVITDIKAAARIGHVESLEIALEGLFSLPNVAANQAMSEAFIEQAILPIGAILGGKGFINQDVTGTWQATNPATSCAPGRW